MEIEKTPIWRNVKVLGWVFQLGILGLVLLVGAFLASNVIAQSSSLGLNLSFDFLRQPSNFPIAGNDFDSGRPVWVAIYEGVLNTLRVVVVGLVLATVLGIALGFGRLSGNMVLRAVCSTYIEVIRNIPLLAILFFANLGLVLELFPRPENTLDFGMFVLNVRGAGLPWFTGPLVGLLAAALIAGIVAYGVRAWRLKVADRRGEAAHVGLWAGLAYCLVLFWGAYFAGIGFSSPSFDGKNTTGGILVRPEYFALVFALVAYTASHIGEIVRGSILAVDKGQVEASQAMALNGWQRMRYVVFPQALRVAVPPIGNQYLNLMKNSSLGLAVAYVDLTKVITTTVGNRSPAVPAFLVLLVIYLVMSLIISTLVNLFNRKLEVAGR